MPHVPHTRPIPTAHIVLAPSSLPSQILAGRRMRDAGHLLRAALSSLDPVRPPSRSRRRVAHPYPPLSRCLLRFQVLSKAVESHAHVQGAGERGLTPLHPGGPPLGGPTSSASSTRRAANVFVRRLPCRGCACVYLCECVCLGGRVCVAAPCEPSRASHACGPPQQILGSRAGPCPASVVCVLAGQLPCFCFCFCGSRVVSVRSVRVALVSRVCLRTSQSTFVLTFPKLHMYALL